MAILHLETDLNWSCVTSNGACPNSKWIHNKFGGSWCASLHFGVAIFATYPWGTFLLQKRVWSENLLVSLSWRDKVYNSNRKYQLKTILPYIFSNLYVSYVYLFRRDAQTSLAQVNILFGTKLNWISHKINKRCR